MIRNRPIIKLYGSEGCHKSRYYKIVLDEIGLAYQFLDVEVNEDHAIELRSLYENGKLNYPTITIGTKKLRNPYKEDILKWMHKLIPNMLEIEHHVTDRKYTLDINGEEAHVAYVWKDKRMYLVHSEVPYHLRGQGFGKELVLKTFEKLTEEGHQAVAVCFYIKVIKNRNSVWKSRIA